MKMLIKELQKKYPKIIVQPTERLIFSKEMPKVEGLLKPKVTILKRAINSIIEFDKSLNNIGKINTKIDTKINTNPIHQCHSCKLAELYHFGDYVCGHDNNIVPYNYGESCGDFEVKK